MIGNRFTNYIPPELSNGSFEQLLKIFMQLVTITSGDVSEALNWMNEVDRQYNLTDDEYGMGDFIEELKRTTRGNVSLPDIADSPDEIQATQLRDNPALTLLLASGASLMLR